MLLSNWPYDAASVNPYYILLPHLGLNCCSPLKITQTWCRRPSSRPETVFNNLEMLFIQA